MPRFSVLQEIQSLDPVRDHVRIQHLSTGFEFSWDTVRALEVALYRTYCVPGISALLARTGEFTSHPQRRYDDTAIIIAELCEWGYESERGRAALERMNFIHSHFRIPNEDYLYVLSTFVFEPIRWNARFGWRLMHENEKQASFHFWREVGRRMGIADIPGTFDALERFSRAYEEQHFRYADSNARIGAATRELFVSWFPRFLAPMIRKSVHAMLDDRMREAFGFPEPSASLTFVLDFCLTMRGRIVRFLPPRRQAHFFTDNPNRTHPGGYDITHLGPSRMEQGTTLQMPPNG